MPKGKPINYTPEILEFIRSDYIGVSNKEMAARLMEKFGLEVSDRTLCRKRLEMGCSSGSDGRFKKGNISYNKGRKGSYAPGCEKGWFKKGHIPKNHRPVGSERISVDGYTEIKVAEPNRWELKHKWIWEQANGPVPKAHAIIFLDGNKRNIELKNLKLIHRRELLVMNSNGLIYGDKEITETGTEIAKLIIATEKRKAERKNNGTKINRKLPD